jgi:hypothetical protein
MTRIDAFQMSTVFGRKILQDLEITYDNAATTATIASGCAVGTDDGLTLMEPGSGISLDIGTSGKNGLDTGSVASSTWYYLYMIFNPDTGEIAGLFSLSASSPTMPSGFTQKRLISAIRTDGSSQFITAVVQQDKRVEYLYYQSALSAGGATSWTSISLASIVPPSITRKVTLQLFGSNVGATNNDAYGAVGSDGVNYKFFAYNRYQTSGYTWVYRDSCNGDVPITVDQTIYYIVHLSNSRLYVRVLGFDLKI